MRGIILFLKINNVYVSHRCRNKLLSGVLIERKGDRNYAIPFWSPFPLKVGVIAHPPPPPPIPTPMDLSIFMKCQVLEKELQFHKAVYDLQISYIGSLFKAVRYF